MGGIASVDNNLFENSTKPTEDIPSSVWSSGVLFHPPSRKYWRISKRWYDLNTFKKRHPGGEQVLELSRDRFEDCTYVFEAHHHNFKRARKILKSYEVKDVALIERLNQQSEITRNLSSVAKGRDELPELLDEKAFYSVVRSRVADYLREVGHADGGPTLLCKVVFWAIFISWATGWWVLFNTGSTYAAIVLGFISSLLGAFGHNWVHQPKYKFWAYLSLDTIGFSSDNWFRNHLLQHHMYTNTPWDNHFLGTEPFLVTDPTRERNFVQKYLCPILNPVFLTFGVWANYTAHAIDLLKGEEVITLWKFLFPVQIGALVYLWGWHGLWLGYACYAIEGVYYFTLALMNHNAEHCLNVSSRNNARDWGESQLHASADWGVNLSFLQASVYLWLNYHTVHHMFPRTDFSHHPAIQDILITTCKEFKIKYVTGHPPTIYKEMVGSFANPLSLMQEIMVYGGGI